MPTLITSLKLFANNLRQRSASPWHGCLPAPRVMWIALIPPLLALLCPPLGAQATPNPSESLELSRPVRPWEFIDATGSRAALLGNESGRLDAWVYPLKILRNFHLIFHAEGHTLSADSLARTVIVRPESTTILYASDSFTVRETMVVPVDKPGALIYLDIHSADPMEVEAVFERDFQLEWPAVLADREIDWSPTLHAFTFGCENPNFTAIIGSPSAVVNETGTLKQLRLFEGELVSPGSLSPGRGPQADRDCRLHRRQQSTCFRL